MEANHILLNISLETGAVSEHNQLRRQAIGLRDEFRELDGVSANLYGENVPEGVSSRADPVTTGTIIVALASAGAFTAVVELVKAWVDRKHDDRPRVQIKVQVGDKLTEFDYSPAQVKEEDLLKFVRSIVDELDTHKDVSASAEV